MFDASVLIYPQDVDRRPIDGACPFQLGTVPNEVVRRRTKSETIVDVHLRIIPSGALSEFVQLETPLQLRDKIFLEERLESLVDFFFHEHEGVALCRIRPLFNPRAITFSDSASGTSARISTASGSVGPRTTLPGLSLCVLVMALSWRILAIRRATAK